MNKPPTEPRDRWEELKTAANWLAFLAQSLAFTVEVILHRGFGARYFGLQVPAGIVVVLVYTLFWPGWDLRPLLGFLAAVLLLCLIGRIGSLARNCSAEQWHSYYTGESRFSRLLPRWSESAIKRFAEPAFVLLCGALMLQFDRPLGLYLMLAAAGLFVSVSLAAEGRRRRELDLHDAYLDQRQLAERFRALRGDPSSLKGHTNEKNR